MPGTNTNQEVTIYHTRFPAPKVKVTRVARNCCRISSVAPCLFDWFASYVAQIPPMLDWCVPHYFNVKKRVKGQRHVGHSYICYYIHIGLWWLRTVDATRSADLLVHVCVWQCEQDHRRITVAEYFHFKLLLSMADPVKISVIHVKPITTVRLCELPQ